MGSTGLRQSLGSPGVHHGPAADLAFPVCGGPATSTLMEDGAQQPLLAEPGEGQALHGEPRTSWSVSQVPRAGAGSASRLLERCMLAPPSFSASGHKMVSMQLVLWMAEVGISPRSPPQEGRACCERVGGVWRGTASLLGSEHDQGTSAARGHRLLLKVFKASHLESRRVPVTRSLEHTHPKPSGKVTADGFCSGTEIWVVRAGSCLFLPRLPSVALSAGRPQGPCVAGAAQGAWLLPWSLRALRGGVPALVPECQSSWPLG